MSLNHNSTIIIVLNLDAYIFKQQENIATKKNGDFYSRLSFFRKLYVILFDKIINTVKFAAMTIISIQR